MAESPNARELAYEQFLDEEGRPRLAPSSVLLWDALGVKAMSTAPEAEASDHLHGLRDAVAAARDRANTEFVDFPRCSTWFTDNVVVAAPVFGPMDEELVIGPLQVDAAYMQLEMLFRGYLSRGAISFGLHYMDETFVFGPALIEAHELEEGADHRWPCVAVSVGVAARNLRIAKQFYAEPESSALVRELLVDEDEVPFVDQLGVWLDEEDDERMIDRGLPALKQVILSKLDELEGGDDRVWGKWRWLADYQDFVLRQRGLDRPEFICGLAPIHAFHVLPMV